MTIAAKVHREALLAGCKVSADQFLQVENAKASIQDEQDLADRLRKEMREVQGDSQRKVEHTFHTALSPSFIRPATGLQAYEKCLAYTWVCSWVLTTELHFLHL